MSVYAGTRQDGDVIVTVDGAELPMRLDLVDHSPAGFAWGYAGSGPSQLALAILAYELRDDALALALYMPFKDSVVSGFDGDAWVLRSEAIQTWVSRGNETKRGGER